MIKSFNRLIEPIKQRLLSLVVKGVVRLVEEKEGVRTLQLNLLADEEADQVEQVQEFGFTSQAPEDSEAVILFLGGDRSHGLVVGTDDPRFRPLGLQPGEVAVYSCGDVLNKDEEPPEEPDAPPGMENIPPGWPKKNENPSIPGPALCRIQLTPDRQLKINCAEFSQIATGGIQIFAGNDVVLGSASKIDLAAPVVTVHSPEGEELDLTELAKGGSIQPVAHIGDPVRFVLNDQVHCGHIVESCSEG